MHDRPFTRDDLLRAMAQAHAHSPEAGERLRWLLHFSESRSVSATCRAFGISRSTFYRWYHRFNPLDLSTLEDVPAVPPLSLRQPAPPPAPVAAAPSPEPSLCACILCRAHRLVPHTLTSPVLVASLLVNIAFIAFLVFEFRSETPRDTGSAFSASVVTPTDLSTP